MGSLAKVQDFVHVHAALTNILSSPISDFSVPIGKPVTTGTGGKPVTGTGSNIAKRSTFWQRLSRLSSQ